jgi:predicted secreted protein
LGTFSGIDIFIATILVKAFSGEDTMPKFTQLLVFLTAACLVLTACGEKSQGTTPTGNENSAHPTIGPTQQKDLVITPTVDEKSATPTIATPLEKTLAPTPDTNEKSVTPTNGTNEDKNLVIKPSIKGQSVTLQVGEVFEVQIPTIPTAGFEWQPQDLDASILVQLGKPVYKADPSPTAAGGIVTLTFKAVSRGKVTLTLLYLHPAVNGLPALYKDSFGVTIEVK